MPLTLFQLRGDIEKRVARPLSKLNFESNLLLAEAELARRIKIIRQERSLRLTCSDNPTVLPYLFLEMQSIIVEGGIEQLQHLTPAFYAEQSKTGSISLGPGFSVVGIDGENYQNEEALSFLGLVLTPKPVDTLPTVVNIVYIQRFKSLEESYQSNALLQYHYDVYLWCVLKHVYFFLEDEGMANLADLQLEKVVGGIRGDDERQRLGLASNLVSSNNAFNASIV